MVLDYLNLCKPKVVLVMLITAIIGMHLATNTFVPWNILFFSSFGIALMSGAAAAINHVVDRDIDAKMQRTINRPLVQNRLSTKQAGFFALSIGLLGFFILFFWVNTLTAVLTLLTFLGYAVLYTRFLKRLTPQNIVIGGAAGAMPPLLGWTAVTNDISAFAWLLVLIIFAWTPPHFWALAIYRESDYQHANVPMLPITHGIAFTKLQVVLYTILLSIISLLPYITGMSGAFYGAIAVILGAIFLKITYTLYHSHNLQTAIKTFYFSIIYLLGIFSALLIDHYLSRFYL
jgi:protoheme IX farnesyltransferase